MASIKESLLYVIVFHMYRERVISGQISLNISFSPWSFIKLIPPQGLLKIHELNN